MASITHVAIGILAGRVLAGRPHLGAMAGMAALSMLPDADVLAFSVGIPYDHVFGHRGVTHSLCFAALMGVLVGLGAHLRGRSGALRAGVIVGLTVATHPLLDAMTDGGRGVALWWPLSETRVFAPLRPIPVAPLGWGIFSPWGRRVMLAEALPSIIIGAAAFWPRRT